MKTLIVLSAALAMSATSALAQPAADEPMTPEPDAPVVQADAPPADAFTPSAGDAEEEPSDNVKSMPVEQEMSAPDAAASDACTPAQSEQLENLGREFALRLVKTDFLGGKDIEHLVQECRFDGAVYQGILHIRWRGFLLGWNQYSVWGRLRTTPDGLEATFAPRGASEGVQSLQFWGNLGTIGLSLVR